MITAAEEEGAEGEEAEEAEEEAGEDKAAAGTASTADRISASARFIRPSDLMDLA
ncbi:hypothetical protein Q0Z83_009900 [Actinoplanes sichuanensis]|nr:hypothetical protein Q0Z83_009900 [Actinoplanes sichuanensis]